MNGSGITGMADLAGMYRTMASQGANLYGLSILKHSSIIGGLIHRTGSKTLLDYGCGAGMAYDPPYEVHRAWAVEKPTLFDPAFASHDVLPIEQFDGVLCSDVLEHVPVEDLDAMMEELFSLARNFVWASVCCRPAKKSFPDGTNLHVTVRPLDWWQEAMHRNANGRFFWLTETP